MKKEERIEGIDVTDDDVASLDEAQSKGMMGFMNVKPEHLSKLSQVDDETELRHLAVMKMAARKFDIDILDDFVKDYLKLKISLQRKGRSEIAEILSTSIKQKINESLQGVMSRLRGNMG